MPYTTPDELIRRFGEEKLVQLTDRQGIGLIDREVLDQAIADADAEIDHYLAKGGYAVPVDPVPRLVTRLSTQIAYYLLFGDVAPDEVRPLYTDAVRLLKSIETGETTLGTQDTGLDAPEVEAGDRVFSMDTLSDF